MMQEKNKKEKQEENNQENCFEKKIPAISAEIVAGFTSEYIENVFTNILKQEKDILKDNNTPEDYLVSIIQGGASGFFEGKFNDFQNVVFSTGLYYGLYAAFDELLGKDVDYSRIAFDFIIDIFFLYLLVLFYNFFIGDNSRGDNSKGNNSEKEDDGFLSALNDALPMEVLISLYYAFRTYFTEKNQENNDKKN